MSDPTPASSVFDRATTFVGIVGSVITICLTVWNTQTKEKIDQREAELKLQTASLDAEIRRRSATVDESKERVDRYKWVYALVPDLSAADAAKRNAALAMVRLALTKTEADGLLSTLGQSADPVVRQAAQQGAVEIAAIENSELARLVVLMNAPGADERRRATGKLQREFDDSTVAIGQAVQQLAPGKIENLSPSGLINTLFYLSRTDPTAWSPEEVTLATAAMADIRAKTPGPQTQAEVARVENVLKAATRK